MKKSFNHYICFSDNTNFQPIYVSQLYGTFFGVFARIDADTSHKDHVLLKEMELHLINYKGIIDLGITRAKFHPNYLTDNTTGVKEDYGGFIQIEVKAMHDSTPKELEVCNINKSHKFPIGEPCLNIERRVAKMHKNSALANGVFDSEFYYREGEINIDTNYQGSTRVTAPDIWDNNLGNSSGLVGHCPRSVLTVIP